MPGGVSPWGVLGLLLVSELPGLLGDHPGPSLGAHAGDTAQVGLGATGPRRRPPKDQHERARAGALPLGVMYTAAVVAFVLYKCLQQGKDEAAVLQKGASKDSLQSEQQLAQLTQQLTQTEQHLNNLMAQLDPLFDCVTTLAGAQQQLLNVKLHTIHQLLQANKPDQGVEVPEPEVSLPFLGDLHSEEAGDSQAEEPINWSPETWNITAAWEVGRGVRKRSSMLVAKGLKSHPQLRRNEGQQLTF